MKPTPLSDVLEHPADAVIYSVRGTLKTVFPRKSGKITKGPNAGNPWVLQNLELTDSSGVVVPVQLKDREDEIPKTWTHREIMLEAHQGPKGWSGVYAFDDDYTNPPTRKIKVTATGNITLIDASNEATTPPKQQQQAPPKQQQQQQQAPPPAQQQQPRAETQQPHQTGTRGDIREVESKANQIANLQLLCLTTTAEYTAARFKERTGRELTTQEIHAMATSMCIELFRSASYTKMPPTRFETRTTQQHRPATPQLHGPPSTWEGKPWPAGAVPDPESGAPIDPETGNFIF